MGAYYSYSDVLQQYRLSENVARAFNTKLNDLVDIWGSVLTDYELLDLYRMLERRPQVFLAGDPDINAMEAANSFYSKHKVSIILGLLASKKQFQLAFNGEMPYAGFGAHIDFEPCWLGLAKTWKDGFGVMNWIHSGAPNISGTAGNPIQIGHSVYFVILGYAVHLGNDAGWKRQTDIRWIQEFVNANSLPTIPVAGSTQVKHTRSMDGNHWLYVQRDSPLFLHRGHELKIRIGGLDNAEMHKRDDEYVRPLGVVFARNELLCSISEIEVATAAELAKMGVLQAT